MNEAFIPPELEDKVERACQLAIEKNANIIEMDSNTYYEVVRFLTGLGNVPACNIYYKDRLLTIKRPNPEHERLREQIEALYEYKKYKKYKSQSSGKFKGKYYL